MDLIRKYFPELPLDQLEKIEQLGRLYPEWNERINVISRKDMQHLFERHIIHSLGIFKFHRFRDGARIMDVGTGGGFPGIPLAIVNPKAKFTLVDSIAKKITVVKDVILQCGLLNTQAMNARAEKIPSSFHFITSRAVTNFPAFYNLVRMKIDKKNYDKIPNGIIYLKGGEFAEEISKFRKKAMIIELSDYFEEEFFSTKKLIFLPFNPKIKNSD